MTRHEIPTALLSWAAADPAGAIAAAAGALAAACHLLHRPI